MCNATGVVSAVSAGSPSTTSEACGSALTGEPGADGFGREMVIVMFPRRSTVSVTRTVAHIALGARTAFGNLTVNILGLQSGVP